MGGPVIFEETINKIETRRTAKSHSKLVVGLSESRKQRTRSVSKTADQEA